jgi:hypothetical protein
VLSPALGLAMKSALVLASSRPQVRRWALGWSGAGVEETEPSLPGCRRHLRFEHVRPDADTFSLPSWPDQADFAPTAALLAANRDSYNFELTFAGGDQGVQIQECMAIARAAVGVDYVSMLQRCPQGIQYDDHELTVHERMLCVEPASVVVEDCSASVTCALSNTVVFTD